MNCAYENYSYIYNIKLMEENTLLIKKKKLSNISFVLLILKSFFINSTKHVFFLEQKLFSKIQFPNTIFFSNNTKNCSQKLFSITVFQK